MDRLSLTLVLGNNMYEDIRRIMRFGTKGGYIEGWT
jgi:hypothetical protein